MDIWLFIGYVGTFIYNLGYILLQTGKIPNGLYYSLFNIVGALLLSISLMVHYNQAALVAQIIWLIISMVGVYKYFKTKHGKIKELHIAFDKETKEQPTHFLFVLDNKIEEVFEYTDKEVWKIIEDNRPVIHKGVYFSKTMKEPLIVVGTNNRTSNDNIIQTYKATFEKIR